jgi:hypothetical protein
VTLTPQEVIAAETVEQIFTRWLADGQTWIGIFENHDLGHRDLGHRVAFSFDLSQVGSVTLKQTRCVDHPTIGMGWRYLLVAQCHTVKDAIRALRGEEVVVH